MYDQQNRSSEMLAEALDQLRSALDLLDSAFAPPHIGAHVDLAIHELYLVVAQTKVGDVAVHFDRTAKIQ